MAQVILNLLSLGVVNILDFPFISPPSTAVIKKGLEQLLCFGAIDSSQKITAHGQRMAALPLDPQYAHMLLRSPEFRFFRSVQFNRNYFRNTQMRFSCYSYSCVSEALSVVSLLSSENIFINPSSDERKQAAFEAHRIFFSRDGDISTLLNAYDAWTKSGKNKGWAVANYINFKALQNADNVRSQLVRLLSKVYEEYLFLIF